MTIQLLDGAWGSARVCELGGCILSWAPMGRELLLVPADEDLVPGQMWHGGIPLCAPWFGVGDGSWTPPMSHGLIARVPWRTLSISSNDVGAEAVLVTSGAEHAHLPGAERYPADLTYQLVARFSATRLAVELTISSPSSETTLDCALHPYWRAESARSRVEGLSGLDFYDAANHWSPGRQEGALSCSAPMDLVFTSAPTTRLVNPDSVLNFQGIGATNIVTWRPAGYADGREFICVEYGNVSDRALRIPAGGQHQIGLVAEVGFTPTLRSEAP